MAERYTTVTRTGCLGNLMGSVGGAVFGVILFVLAFPVAWFGEGRTNMAAVAALSVPVSAAAPAPANDGQLVALTGELTAQPLGDPQLIGSGPYLRLERVVEMYAWVEDRHTERRDNVGGGSTERTTYTYERRWTSSPASDTDFYQPSGHHNPPLPLEGATFTARGGQIGAFALDLEGIGLPAASELRLTPTMVQDSAWRLRGGFLFRGKGSPESPQVGDVRISYRALPAGVRVTAFGEQHGARLDAYRTRQGDVLYRALEGSRAEAIDQLQTEDTLFDWVFRLGSLLMLWLGLTLLFGPLNAMLGVLPALKQAGGCVASLIAFVVAFVLWVVIEAIAIIAHNPWLLLGVIILLAVGGYFVVGRLRARPAQL